MAQLNDNFISFAGTEEQMRQILLVMARNQQTAMPDAIAAILGHSDFEPINTAQLESMDIRELSDFLKQRVEDPLSLLNPMTENVCTSDGYDFERPRKVRGTDLWELDMDFCSEEGSNSNPLDDLGEFGKLLPSGTYSFGGAFRYEGDERFYIDWGDFQCGPEDAEDFDADLHFWYQDDSVWPYQRGQVLGALRETATGDSALSYVAVGLAHAVGDWFFLDEFSGLKHGRTTSGNALEESILELLGEFPVLLGVRLKEARAGAWDSLRPGAPLVVSSYWRESGETSLEVKDVQGSRLGPVYRVGSLSKLPYDEEHNRVLADCVAAIALMLPHLTARFYSANPDTAFVRLEFVEGIDVAELLAGARETTAKPVGKRSLSTKEAR